jgi:hypothetical protein
MLNGSSGLFAPELPNLSSLRTGPVGVAGLMSPPGLGAPLKAQVPTPTSDGGYIGGIGGFNGGISALMGWMGPSTGGGIIHDSAGGYKSKGPNGSGLSTRGLSPNLSFATPPETRRSRETSFVLETGSTTPDASRKSSDTASRASDQSHYFSAFASPKVPTRPTGGLKLPSRMSTNNPSSARAKMEVEEVLRITLITLIQRRPCPIFPLLLSLSRPCL